MTIYIPFSYTTVYSIGPCVIPSPLCQHPSANVSIWGTPHSPLVQWHDPKYHPLSSIILLLLLSSSTTFNIVSQSSYWPWHPPIIVTKYCIGNLIFPNKTQTKTNKLGLSCANSFILKSRNKIKTTMRNTRPLINYWYICTCERCINKFFVFLN